MALQREKIEVGYYAMGREIIFFSNQKEEIT
jgi:hypothetical protein